MNWNTPPRVGLAVQRISTVASVDETIRTRIGTSRRDTRANQAGSNPARAMPSGTSPWISTQPLSAPIAAMAANSATNSEAPLPQNWPTNKAKGADDLVTASAERINTIAEQTRI